MHYLVRYPRDSGQKHSIDWIKLLALYGLLNLSEMCAAKIYKIKRRDEVSYHTQSTVQESKRIIEIRAYSCSCPFFLTMWGCLGPMIHTQTALFVLKYFKKNNLKLFRQKHCLHISFHGWWHAYVFKCVNKSNKTYLLDLSSQKLPFILMWLILGIFLWNTLFQGSKYFFHWPIVIYLWNVVLTFSSIH